MINKIKDNQRTWDTVAEKFFEASALPVWGPFGIGEDLDLIPDIKNKTFLEIGCGSGRSIKYLIQNGAEKVYGLDLSATQIAEATNHNKKAIESGKVQVIHGSMEEKITIEPVDSVVSIYALGWTQEPEKTLANIYSYLKPGGLFIWSWDHSLFSDVSFKDGNYIVEHSYHDESGITLKNWNGSESDTHLTYRKVSTWFKLLRGAGFDIVGFHEPQPVDLRRGSEDPSKYYAIQKAQKVPCTSIFVCKK